MSFNFADAIAAVTDGTRRPVRRVLLTLAVCLLTAGLVGAVPGNADAAPRGTVVVLGDSFTSSLYTPTDACAQTPTNWPSRVARRTGTRLVNTSCLGGKMWGASNVYDQVRRAQRARGFTSSTRAVLVQLGFNDFNGGMTLYRRCVLGGCPGGESQFSKFTAKRFADRLRPLVEYVRYYAPKAKIKIVGYPEIHRRGARDICSGIVGAPVTLPNTSAAPAFTRRLQQAQQGAAKLLSVGFVDLQAATRGHGLCSADPWVQGVLTPVPNDVSSALMVGHPTWRGNAAAASAVLRSGL